MANAELIAFQRPDTPTRRQDGIAEARANRTSSVSMDKNCRVVCEMGFRLNEHSVHASRPTRSAEKPAHPRQQTANTYHSLESGLSTQMLD